MGGGTETEVLSSHCSMALKREHHTHITPCGPTSMKVRPLRLGPHILRYQPGHCAVCLPCPLPSSLGQGLAPATSLAGPWATSPAPQAPGPQLGWAWAVPQHQSGAVQGGGQC